MPLVQWLRVDRYPTYIHTGNPRVDSNFSPRASKGDLGGWTLLIFSPTFKAKNQAPGSSPKGLSEICLFESPKMTNFLSEIAYLTAPRGEIFENPVRKLPI